MRRFVIVVGMLALIAGAIALLWWWERETNGRDLVLYGNVDLRQVDLAFNNSQRITEITVQEGDHVKQGQCIARLDTDRLAPQVARAEAELAAQTQVVERLRSGSRPEEIEQARANLRSAKADAANAERQYQRFQRLYKESSGGAVSSQDVENAGATLEIAVARVQVSEATLELAIAGPRKEEIAEAEARLRASDAELALLRQELRDSQLISPVNGVVRTRIMEPGEMASPQRAVVQLAIVDPKWVRAYVSEPDLGKVRPGAKATVTVDSFPERNFSGWIGFISPVAEFTPKPVQTEELRTSLVYEVRVFVEDPQDELRLGMPATVHVPLYVPIAEASAGKPRAPVEHETPAAPAPDA